MTTPMRTILSRMAVAVLLTGAVAAQGTDGARRVPLAGTPNLRDLGGYATTDGHRVRRGRLYRSSQLSQLTDSDYESVARLGISVVCDFRSDNEREAAPTRWRGAAPPEILRFPTPPGRESSTVTERLPAGATGEEGVAWMRRTYTQIPVAYGPAYRATLQRILASSGPVLYHCSAGKDRTGVFTALLLSFLGVPRETILEDYLLSNAYVATATAIDDYAKRSNVSRDAARAVLSVDRAYLDEAFTAITQKYGSTDNYRRTELALSDRDVVSLKARLLEQ